MAAADAAKEDRWLALDQLAVATGEDRWAVGEARPLLLVAAGGEPFDAAALWKHGTQDRGAAGASGVEIGHPAGKNMVKKGGRVERCLSKQLKMRQFPVFAHPEAAGTALRGLPGSIMAATGNKRSETW